MKRPKIWNPIIEEDKCFECGGSVEEMHHVIPVSLGGTRVIPLCELCHGKVHSLNREGHSLLIREGLRRRQLAGKFTGVANYGFSYDADGRLIPNKKEQKIMKIVFSLRKQGSTIREIVDHLQENSIFNRKNKPFGVAAIHNMVKRSNEGDE